MPRLLEGTNLFIPLKTHDIVCLLKKSIWLKIFKDIYNSWQYNSSIYLFEIRNKISDDFDICGYLKPSHWLTLRQNLLISQMAEFIVFPAGCWRKPPKTYKSERSPQLRLFKAPPCNHTCNFYQNNYFFLQTETLPYVALICTRNFITINLFVSFQSIMRHWNLQQA